MHATYTILRIKIARTWLRRTRRARARSFRKFGLRCGTPQKTSLLDEEHTRLRFPSTSSLNMSWSLTSVLISCCGAVMLRFVVDLVRHERVKRQMPPGPRGLPLLGNLLQMTRLPFIQYMQWAEQYGRYRFALVSDILKQGNCWSRSYILAAYWHGAYRRLERLHDYRRSDRSV